MWDGTLLFCYYFIKGLLMQDWVFRLETLPNFGLRWEIGFWWKFIEVFLKKYLINLQCSAWKLDTWSKISNLNRIFLLCLLWCNPPAWVHLNADSHLSYHPIHRHIGPIYFEVYFLLDVCNVWNKWLFFQIWKIIVLDDSETESVSPSEYKGWSTS